MSDTAGEECCRQYPRKKKAAVACSSSLEHTLNRNIPFSELFLTVVLTKSEGILKHQRALAGGNSGAG